ncbi:MAG: TetR/AcrR family transcriptional regulator [Candidatus Binataceae bacterium]
MATAGPQTQSQDSRDEILKAAIQLFATRGFHETSMSEVAREAKVSKALIFWHFKTKEELFLAVLNKLLEPYVIDFAEESEKLDECEQIRKLIGGYVNFVRENASSVSFFLRRFMNGEEMPNAFTEQIRRLYDLYTALLTDRIRLAQEKGLCLRSEPPDVLANFVLAALNGLLINLLFTGEMPFNLDGSLAMLHGLLFEKAGSQPSAAIEPKQ